MFRVIVMALVTLTVTCFLLSGCSSPTKPSASHVVEEVVQPMVPAPLHHNIPVSLPDGSVGFVCETQLRQYPLPNGGSEWTYDHYVILGKDGCPDVPIK
jgi:hypothetical protein